MIKSSAISRVTRLGSPRLTVISLLTSASRVLTFAEASESAIERSDYKLTLSAASVAKTGFFIHWCCFGVEVPDHVKKDIEEKLYEIKLSEPFIWNAAQERARLHHKGKHQQGNFRCSH